VEASSRPSAISISSGIYCPACPLGCSYPRVMSARIVPLLDPLRPPMEQGRGADEVGMPLQVGTAGEGDWTWFPCSSGNWLLICFQAVIMVSE
jgi:hypothetical protein